jgi:hypothetical protein
MSTKIYNGYKLEKLSLDDLIIFCKGFQKDLINIRNKLMKELYGDNFDVQLFIKLLDRVASVKRTNTRDPLADFSASVCFLPNENNILAITYWNHTEYTKAWESEPIVDDYGYWDNTDQDERCTEEEWATRGVDWQKALPNYSAPSENGFVFDFITLENCIPMPDEIK